MRLNYFDFGVCYGREVGLMEDIVLPSLEITDYMIYGFEPCKSCFDDLEKKYIDNSKVSFINSAISDNDGDGKLYHSYKRKKYTPVGNSLFSTKYNVREDDYEEVDCVLFSKWLIENIPNYKEDFNIIRTNIEGAEWYLFNDLKNKKLFKYIDIFCGADPYEEMRKVGELKFNISKLKDILNFHKIKVITFFNTSDINNFKLEIVTQIRNRTNGEK